MAYMKDSTGRRLDTIAVPSRDESDDRYARYLFNFTGANFRKWAKALAKVRNGEADAKLLCLGDSTTAGAQSSTAATVPALKSYPGQLAPLLNSYLFPAAVGLATPRGTSSAIAADTRWTVGTGWAMNGGTVNFIGFGGKGAFYRGTAPTAGALTFADDRVLADRFDVYYRVGSGAFSATATGGTAVNVAAGGTAAVGKVTVSAATAATTNVVSITATATGNVDIIAVEPYLSTVKKVRVGNAGVSGADTTTWTAYAFAANTNTYGGLDSIKGYAPDLTIIDLGINDAGNTIPAATYLANLQAIIAAAQVSGDVIVKTFMPSVDAAPRMATEATYIPVLRALSVPVIDYYTRVAPPAAYNASGMLKADGVHGTDYGYLDVADVVFRAVRAI